MARRKFNKAPEALPQWPETWHVLTEQLRVWITPPDEEPSRPYAVAVFNLTAGTIQTMNIFPAPPAPDEVAEMLRQAMQRPPKETRQKPHRPERVWLEEAGLAEVLEPEMARIEVAVEVATRPQEMDDMLTDLQNHLRGGEEPPGLLAEEGVTPELAGDMFAAAADFYRAAPWISLNDEQPLVIDVPLAGESRIVQVMGGAGVEYGLATYLRWEDLERMYTFADNPLELIPPGGAHSLIFEDLTRFPFDDLDALETYNWPIANEHAYPTPLIFSPEGGAQRPSRTALIWYTAAMRAIPIFVREHLAHAQPTPAQPLEVTLEVSTQAGKTPVTLKYPAGALPEPAGRPLEASDWSEFDDEDVEFTPFDRRAMEGMMSGFGGGFADPDLQEAQQMMYEAWEETNPGRRIILAHEALSLSPDCADAYVLLAEEEADTKGRALDYYRKGVEAGERALGQEFFEENEGYFWGLLETRPYMRARQGLANLLWDLGQYDESAEHYRGMLRLNPGDNQGVRYSLLNLLLTMNRDDEARTLLKAYDEDAMAEWLYSRALLAFRKGGASRGAEKALRAALGENPHVPPYLTGRKRIPVRLPDFIGWGDENEAVTYAASHLSHWRKTPKAIEWLESHLQPPSKSKSRSR